MDEQAQLELELLFSKNQLLPRLREELCTSDILEYLNQCELDPFFTIDLMAHMIVHRKAPIGVLVGILKSYHTSYHPIEIALQTTAEMILDAVSAGLVSLDTSNMTLTYIVDVDYEIHCELEKYQYPLPMVIEPRKLNHNKQSGYLTHKESVILKRNHTEDDVCLDHLNRMNSIALTLNTDTARMVQNSWRNLDKRKPGETHQDLMDRKKAFNKYDRVSREVIESLDLMSKEFWLTHRYDKRGRTYCQGWHVTYQGTDWNKAVIEFAKKELVA